MKENNRKENNRPANGNKKDDTDRITVRKESGKKSKLKESQTAQADNAYVEVQETEASLEEEKIRRAFQDKDWNEIKSSDSWSIFKTMSEFVEGFEKLAKIGPCVSIFGSARTLDNHPYYKMAEEIAAKLVRHGYGVITGAVQGLWRLVIKEREVRRQVCRLKHRPSFRAVSQQVHRQ